jgi:hypothetical protein
MAEVLSGPLEHHLSSGTSECKSLLLLQSKVECYDMMMIIFLFPFIEKESFGGVFILHISSYFFWDKCYVFFSNAKAT